MLSLLWHHSDVYEEFFNPATAAQSLLHSAISKRKEVLQKTMGFLVQILTAPNLDPRQKSGALHMVGAMADILLQVSGDWADFLSAAQVLLWSRITIWFHKMSRTVH